MRWPKKPMPAPETRSTHKFLRDRAILIGSPISDVLAADVLDALGHLQTNGRGPITIYINSPGGLALAAEKIVRAIGGSSSAVSTHCLGRAGGASAHIFAAGRRRSATSDSIVSFDSFRGDDCVGTAEIEEVMRRFISLTSVALGISPEVLSQWSREERSFIGTSLVKAGIAHEIR